MGGTGCYKVPLWEPWASCQRYLLLYMYVQSTFIGETACHKVLFWEGLVVIRYLFGRGFVIHVQSTFVGGTACQKVLFWEGLCYTCTKYLCGSRYWLS